MDRKICLIRSFDDSSRDGVFGHWLSDSGFTCRTLERLWLDDVTDLSCIRPSPSESAISYVGEWLWSEKHKCNLYHVKDPTRTAIEIHAANIQAQLKGCIAPGTSIATFNRDSISPGMPEGTVMGVINSGHALSLLEKDLCDNVGNQLPFLLTISWQ